MLRRPPCFMGGGGGAGAGLFGQWVLHSSHDADRSLHIVMSEPSHRGSGF